jgi:hypothetical protein
MAHETGENLQRMVGGGLSMARGSVKVSLDIYPCVDELGVRTGRYGARLLVGSQLVEIPAGFNPRLIVGSVNGEPGSGTVEGDMHLKYGGAGDCPAAWADLNGKAVHALKFSGPGGTSISMDVLIAVADSMVPIEMYSKEWVAANADNLPEMSDPTHPYADADNDGIPNWRDADSTDGPGWEPVPEPVFTAPDSPAENDGQLGQAGQPIQPAQGA